KIVRGHVFAWPFSDIEKMQPRGGTSRGQDVVLDEKPSEHWENLQKKAGSKIEKDRRAILALAGSYRVSFDFIETMGFSKGYKPPQPYFSWGTEHVQVLASEDQFISLQHTLVMYFKDEDGKEMGPMVMKHWRQDWSYEDPELKTFRGNSTWADTKLKPRKVKGKWTQAVFQVDDSPRYEVVGEWDHSGGISIWRSDSCWRPLPRREFSARSDYQILQGVHELTITTNGWVHTQQNQKVSLGEGGQVSIVGQELGVNRYERISEPSLMAAETTWEKTGEYWREVREAWVEVYQKHPAFSLKSEVDGKKLYQLHFGYAMKLEGSGEAYDAQAGKAHAKQTIAKFVQPVDAGKVGKY
ncbi:hypothetical protein N9B26_08290, partial [Akkermansiaceae bacterium]|nr:hypothetical protein [Akkermansiaceae bacterium]